MTVRGPSLGDEPHSPASETIHAERDEQSQAELCERVAHAEYV